MHVYVSEFVYMCVFALGGHRRALDPLELELQVVVGHTQCGCWEPSHRRVKLALLTVEPSLQFFVVAFMGMGCQYWPSCSGILG